MMPSLVWRLIWRLCGLPYRFVSLLDLQKNTCWLSLEIKERMSVSLFNAVPAGAVEVLTDATGAPPFRRADLGRYLDIKYAKNVYCDIDTISRESLLRVGLAPSQRQNGHDMFVDLDAALEIVVRSRKPKQLNLLSG